MTYNEFLKIKADRIRALGASYRKLSRMCGFSSPNYIKLVEMGTRHLSPAGIVRVVNGLNFTVEERSVFINMYLDYIKSTDLQKDIKALKDLVQSA